MAATIQNTSISLPARLLCYLGPPSIILLTSVASPRTGLLSPLAFVPTIIGYRAWKRSTTHENGHKKELEPLIWTYVGTATAGFVGLLLGQGAMMVATTRLLFPDKDVRKAFFAEFGRSSIQGLSIEEISTRVALALSWRTWVFNTVLSFGMTGLLEETLKCSPIFFAKRRAQRTKKALEPEDYVNHALASGLSFGLVEGIGFLYAACETQRETGWKLLRTVIERFVVGSTSHALCATLTGLRATRKEVYGDQLSWWGVIAPAVILHGSGNSAAFAFSTIEGNVGWIHPTGLWIQLGMYLSIGTVNLVAGWLVYKEWTGLQNRKSNDRSKKAT